MESGSILQIFIAGSVSGLIGASVTAITSYLSISKQLHFEREKFERDLIFRTKRDSYQEFLHFVNRFIVKRTFREETKQSARTSAEIEEISNVVGKLALYADQELLAKAHTVISCFDSDIPTPQEELNKECNHIRNLRDELINQMREELILFKPLEYYQHGEEMPLEEPVAFPRPYQFPWNKS